MKKKKGRSLGDLILSKMKIVIGFYQVTFGMIEAFAFIKWPESLTFIGKYSEMLKLNVLQIAPIHCLFANLKVDDFGRMYAILSINAAVIIFGFAFYGIRKVLIIRKTLETQEENLQTGNVNMSSESGALKKRGAVRIVRASIHERPKKKKGIPY